LVKALENGQLSHSGRARRTCVLSAGLKVCWTSDQMIGCEMILAVCGKQGVADSCKVASRKLTLAIRTSWAVYLRGAN